MQLVNVPDRMVDFQGLRMLCLERARLCPNTLWTREETEAAKQIFFRHVRQYLDHVVSTPDWPKVVAERVRLKVENPHVPDWRECPGFCIYSRDVDEISEEFEMPKWAALASWLAPESIAGSAPNFIAELAQLAVFGTLGAQDQ